MNSSLKTALLMLDSTEPQIIIESLNKIAQIADTTPALRHVILNEGCLGKIISISSGGASEGIAKAAIICLSVLSDTDTVHLAFCNTAVIKSFIVLLKTSNSPEIKDECAAVLGNIAKSDFVKAQIRNLGGITTILECINASTDPDVLKNASLALLLLIEDDMNSKEVFHKQGIAVLQNLLASTYMEIQKNGLLCLKTLSSYYLSGVEMQKKDTIDKLLEIVAADKMDLPQISLQVVAECLKNHLSAMQSKQVLSMLKTLAASPINDLMINSFAEILSAYFSSKQMNMNDKEAWLSDMVVLLDKSSKPFSILSIILAIIQTNLVGERGSLSAGLYATFWKKITSVLAAGNAPEDRHRAFNVLTLLLTEAHHDKVKVENEFITSILALVKDADVKKQLFMFLYQDHISEDWLQLIVCDKVVMSAITEGVQTLDKHHELIYPAYALHLIIHDVNHIPKITEVRACVKERMNAILAESSAALQSTDESVFLQGVNVLSLVINSHTLDIDEFIASPCIQVLKEVVSARKEKSTLELLWSQVLKEFLPLKFCVTNTLSSEDRITSTFYDAGKQHKFESLSTLKSTQMNLTRETLVVDFQNDENLQLIIDGARKLVTGNYEQTMTNLGKFVADVMGGSIKQKPWNGYKLDVSSLKKRSNTNVIQLGSITNGTYYHRALLLKVICDQLDMLAGLHRANFPVSWNVVMKDTSVGGEKAGINAFVVDLMGVPGKLYAIGSEDSRKYISGML